MSVPTLSETREFGRILESTRENAIPGIIEASKNQKPLISALTGHLSTQIGAGPAALGGRGKRLLPGGESITNRVRLGDNDTMQVLSGPYATYDTTPSSNVRHLRNNWKFYGGTANISDHERQINTSEFQINDLISTEVVDGVESLVNVISADAYANGSVANSITDLDSIVSADDSIGGLSGNTYPVFNSRGVSPRGTASGSISFAGGSFSAQGLDDWRTAWQNASEGIQKPQALFTTHDIYTFYEGSLQPQERFSSPKMADGGFQEVQFKTAPVFADPDCPSGITYMLNFDWIFMAILNGADFDTTPWDMPEAQRVWIMKIFATLELVCTNRKFQNKITGQTA